VNSPFSKKATLAKGCPHKIQNASALNQVVLQRKEYRRGAR